MSERQPVIMTVFPSIYVFCKFVLLVFAVCSTTVGTAGGAGPSTNPFGSDYDDEEEDDGRAEYVSSLTSLSCD